MIPASAPRPAPVVGRTIGCDPEEAHLHHVHGLCRFARLHDRLVRAFRRRRSNVPADRDDKMGAGAHGHVDPAVRSRGWNPSQSLPSLRAPGQPRCTVRCHTDGDGVHDDLLRPRASARGRAVAGRAGGRRVRSHGRLRDRTLADVPGAAHRAGNGHGARPRRPWTNVPGGASGRELPDRGGLRHRERCFRLKAPDRPVGGGRFHPAHTSCRLDIHR